MTAPPPPPRTAVVTDPADPLLDDYRSLRNRELRDGLYAEGPTVVSRLLSSGLSVRSVLVTPAALERLGAELGRAGCDVVVAAADVIREALGFSLHRGAIAIGARPRPVPLGEALRGARRLVLLEGINDHENLGAVARSALALGADGLVLDPTCADPFYRRSVRVSMGALLTLPVVRSTDWAGTLDAIAAAGFDVWALTPDPAARSAFAMPVAPRIAFLAGAEGPGLCPATLARFTNVVVPLRKDVDSLNVAHAVVAAMAIAAAASHKV